MPTKTLGVDEDVYEMLVKRKRDDETYSDVVERFFDGRSLSDPTGIYSEEEVGEDRR